MATIIRHDDTCTIKMSKSSKTVEAVVQNFIFEKTLDVVLNKSVKLSLKWNGRLYEGRGAGMDVESTGPEIHKTQTGIRG
jgi:hypothetical protein